MCCALPRYRGAAWLLLRFVFVDDLGVDDVFVGGTCRSSGSTGTLSTCGSSCAVRRTGLGVDGFAELGLGSLQLLERGLHGGVVGAFQGLLEVVDVGLDLGLDLFRQLV